MKIMVIMSRVVSGEQRPKKSLCIADSEVVKRPRGAVIGATHFRWFPTRSGTRVERTHLVGRPQARPCNGLNFAGNCLCACAFLFLFSSFLFFFYIMIRGLGGFSSDPMEFIILYFILFVNGLRDYWSAYVKTAFQTLDWILLSFFCRVTLFKIQFSFSHRLFFIYLYSIYSESGIGL